MQNSIHKSLPFLLDQLVKVSKKRNYKYNIIDRNLIQIVYGDKSFFAGANSDIGINPINAHFAAEIANDKARCLSILKNGGFSVPEGEFFFIGNSYTENGRGREDAIRYAQKTGFPIFVKPNSSRSGNCAQIIYSTDELIKIMEKISKIDPIFLIQKIINLPEYRVVVLDGDFQYFYKKATPQITGDGIKNIKELIEEFNYNIGKNVINQDSNFIKLQLKQKKLSKNSILNKGMTLKVSAISNLWMSGKPVDYSETISDATQKWLKEISRCLNLRLMGLDIFVEDSINNPESLIVLEVNHNPEHKGARQEKVEDIISRVCQKYFTEYN